MHGRSVRTESEGALRELTIAVESFQGDLDTKPGSRTTGEMRRRVDASTRRRVDADSPFLQPPFAFGSQGTVRLIQQAKKETNQALVQTGLETIKETAFRNTAL